MVEPYISAAAPHPRPRPSKKRGGVFVATVGFAPLNLMSGKVMASLRYREKFRNALYYLAVQEGDVRDRLRTAYNQLRSLREDELPAELRNEWKDILHQLTKKEALIHESGHVIQNSLDRTLDAL